jgi:hypothetical protein
MSTLVASGRQVGSRILEHLLRQIDRTPSLNEPFAHLYLEEVFPEDLYTQILSHLPNPQLYPNAADRHQGRGGPEYARSCFPLTRASLAPLATAQQELWGGVATAMTAPELKEALFTKLARDLAFRYGVAETRVGQLAGYARPMLYRETDGYEIAPHPDTRKKIVTLHLFLPADSTQAALGTALYRRKLLAWPFGPWQRRFIKVKQFPFLPNTGYAFAVNNSLTRKSWHGRDSLPLGSGVRNTLLSAFYESPRQAFSDYLS